MLSPWWRTPDSITTVNQDSTVRCILNESWSESQCIIHLGLYMNRIVSLSPSYITLVMSVLLFFFSCGDEIDVLLMAKLTMKKGWFFFVLKFRLSFQTECRDTQAIDKQMYNSSRLGTFLSCCQLLNDAISQWKKKNKSIKAWVFSKFLFFSYKYYD